MMATNKRQKRQQRYKIYCFECGLGCGLRLFKNIAEARKQVVAEVGTFNSPHSIRLATAEDISSVRAMGGWVPDLNDANK